MMKAYIDLLGHNFRRYWAVLLGTILLAGGLLISNGRAQPKAYAQAQPTPGLTSSSLRTISVTGSGSVDVTPDIAVVVLGVQTDAQSASQALSQNNTQMQAVMSALQTAGIPNADIQTTTIQLAPRYDNNNNPQPGQAEATPTNRLLGYTATNTVQVKVRKLDSLGALLDQVVSAGGNQIQSISFDVSNPVQSMDQARQAAMNDAMHKAQQLANLANARLGTVLTINETTSSPVPFAAALAQPAVSGVPVSPGTQTVTVELQVTWELEPQ